MANFVLKIGILLIMLSMFGTAATAASSHLDAENFLTENGITIYDAGSNLTPVITQMLNRQNSNDVISIKHEGAIYFLSGGVGYGELAVTKFDNETTIDRTYKQLQTIIIDCVDRSSDQDYIVKDSDLRAGITFSKIISDCKPASGDGLETPFTWYSSSATIYNLQAFQNYLKGMSITPISTPEITSNDIQLQNAINLLTSKGHYVLKETDNSKKIIDQILKARDQTTGPSDEYPMGFAILSKNQSGKLQLNVVQLRGHINSVIGGWDKSFINMTIYAVKTTPTGYTWYKTYENRVGNMQTDAGLRVTYLSASAGTIGGSADEATETEILTALAPMRRAVKYEYENKPAVEASIIQGSKEIKIEKGAKINLPESAPIKMVVKNLLPVMKFSAKGPEFTEIQNEFLIGGKSFAIANETNIDNSLYRANKVKSINSGELDNTKIIGLYDSVAGIFSTANCSLNEIYYTCTVPINSIDGKVLLDTENTEFELNYIYDTPKDGLVQTSEITSFSIVLPKTNLGNCKTVQECLAKIAVKFFSQLFNAPVKSS